ncbi:MAG: C80 family cysteine peptidase [Pseudomonadota bacterium]
MNSKELRRRFEEFLEASRFSKEVRHHLIEAFSKSQSPDWDGLLSSALNWGNGSVFTQILQFFPHLKKLHLGTVDSSMGVWSVSQWPLSIEEISMGIKGRTAPNLSELINLKKLVVTDIEHRKLTQGIELPPSIEELYWPNRSIPDLSELKFLRALGIRQEGPIDLDRCPRTLEELELEMKYNKQYDADLNCRSIAEDLRQFGMLKKLTLKGIYGGILEAIPLQLVELYLGNLGSEYSDSMPALRRLTTLKKLSIAEARFHGDKGNLQYLPETIEEFHFINCTIDCSINNTFPLWNLPNLTTFGARGCSIQCISLAKLPNLITFDAQHCSIETIYLDNLPRLTTLNAPNCRLKSICVTEDAQERGASNLGRPERNEFSLVAQILRNTRKHPPQSTHLSEGPQKRGAYKLTSVNLEGNELNFKTLMSFLLPLEDLTTLNLANNSYQERWNIYSFRKMRFLDVRGNTIQNIATDFLNSIQNRPVAICLDPAEKVQLCAFLPHLNIKLDTKQPATPVVVDKYLNNHDAVGDSYAKSQIRRFLTTQRQADFLHEIIDHSPALRHYYNHFSATMATILRSALAFSELPGRASIQAHSLKSMIITAATDVACASMPGNSVLARGVRELCSLYDNQEFNQFNRRFSQMVERHEVERFIEIFSLGATYLIAIGLKVPAKKPTLLSETEIADDVMASLKAIAEIDLRRAGPGYEWNMLHKSFKVDTSLPESEQICSFIIKAGMLQILPRSDLLRLGSRIYYDNEIRIDQAVIDKPSTEQTVAFMIEHFLEASDEAMAEIKLDKEREVAEISAPLRDILRVANKQQALNDLQRKIDADPTLARYRAYCCLTLKTVLTSAYALRQAPGRASVKVRQATIERKCQEAAIWTLMATPEPVLKALAAALDFKVSRDEAKEFNDINHALCELVEHEEIDTVSETLATAMTAAKSANRSLPFDEKTATKEACNLLMDIARQDTEWQAAINSSKATIQAKLTSSQAPLSDAVDLLFDDLEAHYIKNGRRDVAELKANTNYYVNDPKALETQLNALLEKADEIPLKKYPAEAKLQQLMRHFTAANSLPYDEATIAYVPPLSERLSRFVDRAELLLSHLEKNRAGQISHAPIANQLSPASTALPPTPEKTLTFTESRLDKVPEEIFQNTARHSTIEAIDFSHKGIEGEIDLSKFTCFRNLSVLNFSGNAITRISGLSELMQSRSDNLPPLVINIEGNQALMMTDKMALLHCLRFHGNVEIKFPVLSDTASITSIATQHSYEMPETHKEALSSKTKIPQRRQRREQLKNQSPELQATWTEVLDIVDQQDRAAFLKKHLMNFDRLADYYQYFRRTTKAMLVAAHTLRPVEGRPNVGIELHGAANVTAATFGDLLSASSDPAAAMAGKILKHMVKAKNEDEFQEFNRKLSALVEHKHIDAFCDALALAMAWTKADELQAVKAPKRRSKIGGFGSKMKEKTLKAFSSDADTGSLEAMIAKDVDKILMGMAERVDKAVESASIKETVLTGLKAYCADNDLSYHPDLFALDRSPDAKVAKIVAGFDVILRDLNQAIRKNQEAPELPQHPQPVAAAPYEDIPVMEWPKPDASIANLAEGETEHPIPGYDSEGKTFNYRHQYLIQTEADSASFEMALRCFLKHPKETTWLQWNMARDACRIVAGAKTYPPGADGTRLRFIGHSRERTSPSEKETYGGVTIDVLAKKIIGQMIHVLNAKGELEEVGVPKKISVYDSGNASTDTLARNLATILHNFENINATTSGFNSPFVLDETTGHKVVNKQSVESVSEHKVTFQRGLEGSASEELTAIPGSLKDSIPGTPINAPLLSVEELRRINYSLQQFGNRNTQKRWEASPENNFSATPLAWSDDRKTLFVAKFTGPKRSDAERAIYAVSADRVKDKTILFPSPKTPAKLINIDARMSALLDHSHRR